MTTASQPAASARTASRSSRADVTRTTSAPATSGSPAAVTSTTSGAAGDRAAGERVALLAGGAVAQVAHRVEVLAGAAGRHQHAPPGQVGGAVPRASTARHSRASSSGSGSRPLPLSLPVSRPTAGSTTSTPRLRSVATLACVAGCSHISVCIAGASTTGQRAVSSVLVSRSSARPCAAVPAGRRWPGRPRRGRRSGRSARAAPRRRRPRCCRSPAARTAPPRSRRRRSARALAVGTTRTSCPVSVSCRSSSTALYAAMPPATPRTTRGRVGTLSAAPGGQAVRASGRRPARA